MVEAVKTDQVRRKSIFGWWLAPGEHYQLEGDTEDGSEEEEEEDGASDES